MQVIKADTIDVAVERILVELWKHTTSSRENAIYFDGWDGLGASSVLQAVAKRLEVSNELSKRPAGLEFEKIIHIDCSKWKSRRAMQREIAEQLNLPNWVMEIFDKQDEEDGFNGLDEGSRTEIAQVVREIYQRTQNQRFLVILHNGSSEEIDIFDFGLSLDRYSSSKMLWTFQGRFRLDPKMIDSVKKSTTTGVLLSASGDRQDPRELWSYLVSHEAAQVSSNKYGHVIIDPAIAAQCVLYMLKQSWIGSRIIDYDRAIHTSNYWICAGIIALTDIDRAWRVGAVLQHEMPFLNIDTRLKNDESAGMASYHLAKSAEHMPYWISTTTSTSRFVVSPSGVIPENMFSHSHMLGVLKLSRCAFSFSSPPFLCCHSLRFLWLEHCRDLVTGRSTTDHHHTEANKELGNRTTTSWECFQSLWVLDLRYTGWDQIWSTRVMDLMTQLRELNVMGAENWDMSHLRGWLRNIRKFRVTKSTCFFSDNMLSEMENMELLDFSGNIIRQGMASNSTFKTGYKELKNLYMKRISRGLEELDLSGTSVKTLDLRGVEAKSLPKRIILLGCEKLGTIGRHHLQFHMLIDPSNSIKKKPTVGGSYAQGMNGNKLVQAQPKTSTIVSSEYVLKTGPVEVMIIWECPKIVTKWNRPTCIIKVIMHRQGNKLLENALSASTSALSLPDIIYQTATSLHVYDNSSITSISAPPQGPGWYDLGWCPVERCPKLRTVFAVPQRGAVNRFGYPHTFWASQLLSARHIYSMPIEGYCEYVDFLHLDYCPRLVHVLSVSIRPGGLMTHLITLEILWCGDLREVFPLSLELQEQDNILECPMLRRIHLHELPMLHYICGRRIFAPKLKIIKIRGCWSLERLPAIGRNTKPPMVDCEKEWWDNLEWDGLEKYHHPSLYKPSHSVYYKPQLPRGTILK
ncbi:uncharacterized protein [Triticum aestivum]|uniref:uncharacterized protein n=1 Tax=Triticum aestivum TaxID=4565 RepID=UPI001D020918|nr:uncharacterized protein LOC123129300 [Triticum aestivum]